MKNFSKLFIPSTLFLLTLFVVGTNLDKPFWGEHDWNGARYGNIAKNYLRYGFLNTKFGQVENGEVTSPKNFIHYTHYQPLLPILISVSYKLAGISEYATRLVPLIATAGFMVVIYLIGRELVSWQMGLTSSLLVLATPMARYYGKNPVHEPLALFFASLSFLGAIIIKKGNKKGWFILITGFIFTALTNWSYIFLLPPLSVFLFNKTNRKTIILLWSGAILFVVLHFSHTWLLTGSLFGGGLLGAFLERTSLNQAVKFSFIEYLLQIRIWASTLFTNTLLASALIGLILLLKSKMVLFKKFILAVFIYSIYPVFFADASFIHSYFIYYFLLPLGILGGFALTELCQSKKIFYVISLLVLIGIWFERSSFVYVLNVSSGDKTAVELSKILWSNTPSGDKVMIEPESYEFSRLPILSYYSERKIVARGDTQWRVKVEGDQYEITKNLLFK